MNKTNEWMARLAVPAILMAASATALAQEAPPPTVGGLQEIVVTAQRRAQSAQDVPLSMTALSQQTLADHAVTDFRDYAQEVPGLAFGYTGDGTATARTVSIRGISGDNTTGFYIDETPVPDSIDPRVVDVARIEVLRGPQGTLYGARSMGGTVRLITVDPDLSAFSGSVKANGSHTEDAATQNYGVDTILNIPLIADRVGLRLVAFAQHDGGFFKRRFLTNPGDAALLPPNSNPTTLGNLPTSTVDDVGRTNSFGGAGTLLIKVSDALSITPRIMFQKANTNGFNYTDVGAYPLPVPSPPPTVDMHPGGFTQYRFFNVPESSVDHWVLASLAVKWKLSGGALSSSTSYFDRTVDETEDETDFLWQNIFSPFDGIPLPPNGSTSYHAVPIASSIEELKQLHEFVEEVRFVSELQGPWQYVTGAFYQDTRGRLPFAGYYPPALAPGLSQTGGALNGFLPLNPAIPDEIFGQDFQTRQREVALYGELSYSFTPKLKATVGVRGYDIRSELAGYLEGLAFGGARLTDPPSSVTANGANPKVEVDYHFDPDKMVYVLGARGYRPGGLVPSIPGNSQVDPLGCFAQLKALGYTSADQTKSYKPDNLWDYEVGAKTEWADHRLLLNASAYYVNWKNIQQLVALACGFQFRANAGAADVKGFDLEMSARPFDPLTVSLGLGYQPARITQSSPAVPGLVVGARVYQVPDWTGTASATYTAPINATSSIITTIDYSYTGNSTSANVTPATPRIRPSYTLLDARIAYEMGNYQIAFVGKNLTNTEADLADNRSLAAETLGRPRLVINPPRTLGVELSAQF